MDTSDQERIIFEVWTVETDFYFYYGERLIILTFVDFVRSSLRQMWMMKRKGNLSCLFYFVVNIREIKLAGKPK